MQIGCTTVRSRLASLGAAGAPPGHGARSVVEAPLAGCVSLPYGGPPPFPSCSDTPAAAGLLPGTEVATAASSPISHLRRRDPDRLRRMFPCGGAFHAQQHLFLAGGTTHHAHDLLVCGLEPMG
ncbi:hypothetical protein U9M48_025223 [Paspalum notatum var. saurae]|uniref:Uncharacterized protein n=1 Tax=Paspalum notatum var. saurae TaxID=547442 RepID=A0AAQ3TT43_PASNO